MVLKDIHNIAVAMAALVTETASLGTAMTALHDQLAANGNTADAILAQLKTMNVTLAKIAGCICGDITGIEVVPGTPTERK